MRFLTALPLPGSMLRPGELGRSAAFFPVVGLLLGGALAGLDAILRLAWPVSLASAVVLVALVLLTGGLHIDGLMDSCDGLFGRREPERRLEIMRDSRVGSFGAVGAVCVLLVKFAALSELPDVWRIGGLVLMATLSRWAMVVAIWGFPYARAQGLGRVFKDEVRWRQVIVATLIAAAAAGLGAQASGAAVFAVAALAMWLTARFICTRIPGLTGDSYGAVNEVVEVVVLLMFVTLARMSHA